MMSTEYIFVSWTELNSGDLLKFLLIDSKSWQIMIWGNNVLASLDSIRFLVHSSLIFIKPSMLSSIILILQRRNKSQVSCFNSFRVINSGDWFASGSSIFKYCQITSIFLRYLCKGHCSVDRDSAFYWGG